VAHMPAAFSSRRLPALNDATTLVSSSAINLRRY
jgi:hypothetical protein